jgi:hypothetical protein
MGAHGMINYVDARTSWMDGVVAAAVRAGVSQVVIIAAGYCTRAYRLHQPGVKVRSPTRCTVHTQDMWRFSPQLCYHFGAWPGDTRLLAVAAVVVGGTLRPYAPLAPGRARARSSSRSTCRRCWSARSSWWTGCCPTRRRCISHSWVCAMRCACTCPAEQAQLQWASV